MRRRRWLVGLAGLALVCAVVWMERRAVLLWLGDCMVASDPRQPAEIAIMTDGSQLAGALELADLYRERTVPRVAVLVPAPSPEKLEAARRGVAFDDLYQTVIDLGTPAESVARIHTGSGTTGAVEAIATWCQVNGIHRVMLVTTAEHSRRLRRAFQRASHGRGLEASIDLARFDNFHRDDWWQDRDTLRVGLVELQKVLLDHLQHPLH